MTVGPVRPITLDEVRRARERIAGTVVRTPLIRLELGDHAPDIRLAWAGGAVAQRVGIAGECSEGVHA